MGEETVNATTQQASPAEMLAYLAEHEPGTGEAWAVTYPIGHASITWDYELFTRRHYATGFALRRGDALMFTREDGTWKALDLPEPDDIACGELDGEAMP